MGPLGGRNKKGLVAEINVTPLVDVMLVLLIIFMVTAPMMTQGLEVDLPKTTAKALRQHEEPIVITIKQSGEVMLGQIQVSASLLRQQLGTLSEEKKKEPVYLRADEKVPYGVVVATMADIRASGFEKVGMITLPSDKEKQGQ
ncbi:protein TolR [Desulfogranum japonicum]|uniref:protein TolR n=1 Tax=Desulfogranum japonicum TaxID=231447 RepID=UPI00040B186E|nr:protein TolR [Desulfogranum japonicum]